MRTRLSFLIAALAALSATFESAAAQEQCGAPLAMTPALVEAAAQFEFQIAETPPDTPALLVSLISPLAQIEGLEEGLYGSVLFARDGAESWRALILAPSETEVAVYRAGAELAFFTMVQSEGPGQSWTLVRSADAFVTSTCVAIAFPSALNNPQWANEYLELLDFDIAASGRGEIIASARVERGGEEKLWLYRFTTRDGGATWTAPQRIRRQREARGGRFAPAPLMPASVGVVSELQNFAARD